MVSLRLLSLVPRSLCCRGSFLLRLCSCSAPGVLPVVSGCSFGKKSVSFGKKAESAFVFLLCRKKFVSLHRLSRERRQRWGATFDGSKDAYYRV